MQAETSITLEATDAQKDKAKAEMIQKTALDLVTVLNIMHYAEELSLIHI